MCAMFAMFDVFYLMCALFASLICFCNGNNGLQCQECDFVLGQKAVFGSLKKAITRTASNVSIY